MLEQCGAHRIFLESGKKKLSKPITCYYAFDPLFEPAIADVVQSPIEKNAAE